MHVTKISEWSGHWLLCLTKKIHLIIWWERNIVGILTKVTTGHLPKLAVVQYFWNSLLACTEKQSLSHRIFGRVELDVSKNQKIFSKSL